MPETVLALFDHFEDAQRAIEDLQDNNFRLEDIGLIARDTAGDSATNPGVKRVTERRDVDQRENVGAGAGIGGLLGGAVGLLAGLGSFAIPGFGAIIVAGPLLAALTGACVGAATGGLVGALTSSGIPDEEAQDYVEGVRRGATLVLVKAAPDRVKDAGDIMSRYHPRKIDEGAVDWHTTSWSGDASATQPQVSDDAFSDDRRAYLFGYRLNNDTQYHGRNWDDIVIRVRQDWEREEPDKPWNDYRDAIHEGWDRANEHG